MLLAGLGIADYRDVERAGMGAPAFTSEVK
jgi:hypothetical protein